MQVQNIISVDNELIEKEIKYWTQKRDVLMQVRYDTEKTLNTLNREINAINEAISNYQSVLQ